MTRKHFEKVASVLAIRVQRIRENDISSPEAKVAKSQEVYAIANALADAFSTENPRFDRQRFLIACGF